MIKNLAKNSQVFIAGCGPVGLTLAKCLANSPYIQSVTLLDRKIPNPERPLSKISNQRVYSLNKPTLDLLKNLGIYQDIRLKGIMSQIQVVSKQSQQFVNWTQNQSNIVQNDEIVYLLMKHLKQKHHDKINLIEDEVSSYNVKQEVCQVQFAKSQQKIQCKLLVGSDGNKSKIKEIAKIPTYGWNYRQRAIVCTMQISQGLKNQTGYQIYHDGNVLAVLPLWENYVSLVWSLGIPDFQYHMKLGDQQFCERLNNVIDNSNYCMNGRNNYVKIPEITKIINKRLSFPLSTLQSAFYTGQRIALVGDAAHSIHPMAGLGVNSGIMDSILLANNIIRNIKTGNDIGDGLCLSEYQSQAKAFNYQNSLAMQSIKKAFEIDSRIINFFRKLGIKTIQESDRIKQGLKGIVQGQNMIYQWQK